MSVYEFSVKDKKGNDISLEKFKGKVLLIVNTATKCGYTKQYTALENLYKKYNQRGFEILDFPCNQFAGQAPQSDDEILEFCTLKFGITFPQFAKISVNGKNEIPLYTYLKSKKSGINSARIRWNFTKFLIDRNGEVADRFDSAIKPEELEAEIEKLL